MLARDGRLTVETSLGARALKHGCRWRRRTRTHFARAALVTTLVGASAVLAPTAGARPAAGSTASVTVREQTVTQTAAGRLFADLTALGRLDRYYPNMTRSQSGYFLTGSNYADPAAPSLSVLWFTDRGNGTFRQYNSSPFDQCHWDELRWADGVLWYEKTHDECGTNNNEIDYSPGIVFMPQRWRIGSAWAVTGASTASYYDGGKLVCTGTNRWVSQAVGGTQAPTFQNTQSTSWTSGADRSGCAAGYVTHWRENFYLAGGPVLGTSTSDLALVREVGGNLDRFAATHRWDYDVRVDGWQRLP